MSSPHKIKIKKHIIYFQHYGAGYTLPLTYNQFYLQNTLGKWWDTICRSDQTMSPSIFTPQEESIFRSIWMIKNWRLNRPMIGWNKTGCCKKAACLFLAAQLQNNHTKTIIFKSLAISSILLFANPFPLFYILPWGSWPTGKVPTRLSPVAASWFLLWLCPLSRSIQPKFWCRSVFYLSVAFLG